MKSSKYLYIKLSQEDKTLFRSMMQDVVPLTSNNKLASPYSPKATKKFLSAAIIEKDFSHILSISHNSEILAPESVMSYAKIGIPRKRFHQLKQGNIPRLAILDLHGLRPDKACQDLCQFVESQSKLGHRCVLIIHGKGGHKGEAPVLKNNINQWLRSLSSVLAFHSALPHDGGTGALYVLLRNE